jgi:hypothetical protein
MKTEMASLAALLLAAGLTPAAANAASLETFTFTQKGYPVDDVLTGTFTGVVEADGSIQQADLTAFTASFFYDEGPLGVEVDTYSLVNLELFSFSPSMDGPNSSLDIFASVTSGTPAGICVGAAAAFGLCQQGGNVAGVDHVKSNEFLWLTTTQFAAVQFVPVQTTVTPEPASIGLCGLALARAIVCCVKKRLARNGRRRHNPHGAEI